MPSHVFTGLLNKQLISEFTILCKSAADCPVIVALAISAMPLHSEILRTTTKGCTIKLSMKGTSEEEARHIRKCLKCTYPVIYVGLEHILIRKKKIAGINKF